MDSESATSLGLFQGVGVELEYMIVDRSTLNVLPIADKLLQRLAGELVSDFDMGDIMLSNELALHVIELKTNGPAVSTDGLSELFASTVQKLNKELEEFNAMLLPTAMHPWMDPDKEMQIWPHDNNEIYDCYNRIFNCGGHGWSNVQSVHINLPFNGDEEFGRLHAAIRLMLPLIPAIAGSSPIYEKKITGLVDNRLEFYRQNQIKVPSIAGQIIPEAVFNRKDYEEKIFKKIYSDIKPYDPDGLLQFEWLNSRGAIARFDRNAIEIRLVDIQESPQADLAIVSFIVESLKLLVDETLSSYEIQKQQSETELNKTLLEAIKNGQQSLIKNEQYLSSLGLKNSTATVAEVLGHLFNVLEKQGKRDWHSAFKNILQNGTLSERILSKVKSEKGNIEQVYRHLGICLDQNKLMVNGS